MKNQGLATRFAITLGCGLALAAAGFATPPQVSAPTRFEESHEAVQWTGAWSTNPLAVNSGGGARLAMDAGSEATFTFSGSSASWIGYRDEWCGEAEVLVDGVRQAMVDTYSTPAQAQATLYTTGALGEGRHTLTIRAKGTHNPRSGGSWIWVDAFTVSGSGLTERPSVSGQPGFVLPPDPTARSRSAARDSNRPRRGVRSAALDESNSAAAWTGAWSTNQLSTHSGRHARLSMDPSARVDFTFTGTGVSWIGYRDEWSGIAEVFLDGKLQTTVDAYSATARPQVELFAIDGLENGPHTLTIQPTGRHRQGSGGAWVWVDGFAIAR